MAGEIPYLVNIVRLLIGVRIWDVFVRQPIHIIMPRRSCTQLPGIGKAVEPPTTSRGWIQILTAGQSIIDVYRLRHYQQLFVFPEVARGLIR